MATNRADPKQALGDYRKRWGIECLFGDAKTRGLNLEDTHITNPEKLASLIVVVMLAITWAYRCAPSTMGMKAIPAKAMAAAKNPGSASVSTRSETGYSTAPKQQPMLGSKKHPEDQ
ncbi:hypothetical protein EH240_31130 [Mesorhizobium tamadayense]|uniref:Transposase IS4-like domain-containing protein n=1 Tax=Mesorhizobium tamadayense TaxID=425306 RepID=A0A3P3F201_9HYPH|nr:transposase [Mesorhizobium tamadayense]RRH92162.1 hypothetical protein EH240_31130 [Mesorhizobium tamadayense]